MSFDTSYRSLNQNQKKAVDYIDGPLMVIAGPGTGKTQLLATRAANILQNNSTLAPTNLLCLTFTEAGQVAMQRRLIELIGEAGTHIAVHTFHSFCSEIISTHPDYFFNSVSFSPADELSTHEVLNTVLDTLPARNPLAVKHEDEYALIGAVKKRIQELKKAALEPEQFGQLIKNGLDFVDYIEPHIIKTFDVASFSKRDLAKIDALYKAATDYDQKPINISMFKPLSTVFTETLASAYASASEDNSTKPITNWKKDWFAKDENKNPICKQKPVLEKLAELNQVYKLYQKELAKRRLYDFDDMIMKVVHALETRGDLAYELQEQYQYLLVDEFQDTNTGQMRLLDALAQHPVHEGNPNLMVVGDDDQAIYAFQGAELSNIVTFLQNYPNAPKVTLTDNYRSTSNILSLARAVIVQGEQRLENQVAGIDKTLTPKTDQKSPNLSRLEFATQAHEYEHAAGEIAKQINQGVEPNEIAVIAREHKQLEAFLPYLFDKNIPVAYERRENALEQPKIKELLNLANVVHFLAIDKPYQANELMPELLSADYWQLPATDIWQLSLSSRRVKSEFEADKLWLNVMLTTKGKLNDIAKFLLEAARYAKTHRLEEVLDVLVGNTDSYISDSEDAEADDQKPATKIASPFKNYYFSDQILKNQPDDYINLLAALTALRSSMRTYHPDETHTLKSFYEFCELAKRAKVPISVKGIHATSDNAVQLLSAHKSKGLEFDTVFVLSATAAIWDSKGRGGGISLSPNMLTIAHTPNVDDNLRLFYVALTRAKRQLYISSYQMSDAGKETVPLGALADEKVLKIAPQSDVVHMPSDTTSRLVRAERQWFDKHLNLPNATLKSLLADRLEYYALSATHLNNFLDVAKGGPQKFFLHNLLQFPSAMTVTAAYGSAMHTVLEYLHVHFIKNATLPKQREAEDFFKSVLARKGLLPTDFKRYLGQGNASLQEIYKNKASMFTASQKPEQDFRNQGVFVGDARLTGKLDVLEITKNKAVVTDYKTGNALSSWDSTGKTAYEKEKTHRYKQQLLFYKLLVDGSRTWGEQGVRAQNGKLLFVEPNKKGSITGLELNLDDSAELDRLKKLITAVWQRIQNLDFPDISEYSTDVKGIIEFEDWLIENS